MKRIVFISCIAFFSFIALVSCGGEENNPPVDNQPTDEDATTDDATDQTDDIENDNVPIDDDQIVTEEEPDQDVTVDDVCIPEVQMMAGKWEFNAQDGTPPTLTYIEVGVDNETKKCYLYDGYRFYIGVVPADSNPLIGTVENGGCNDSLCYTLTYQTDTDTLKVEDTDLDGSNYRLRIFYRAPNL